MRAHNIYLANRSSLGLSLVPTINQTKLVLTEAKQHLRSYAQIPVSVYSRGRS